MTESDRLTALLESARDGNGRARDQLFAAVYDRLRELARTYMRRERQGHTLEPTALVHEACMGLLQGAQPLPGRNRAELLALLASAMRRILVDHARRRGRHKRGGDWNRVDLDARPLICSEPDERLVPLDESLRRLEEVDRRKSQVVELRFFGGLSIDEIGEVLEISPATVKRDWQVARTWLYRDVSEEGEHDAG